MKKNWDDGAWAEYLHWQERDRAKAKCINELLKAIERDPFSGIGRPEQLRHGLSGWWSREIDPEHRLVYRITGGAQIDILRCRGHYGP
jgi:toxin YoeB